MRNMNEIYDRLREIIASIINYDEMLCFEPYESFCENKIYFDSVELIRVMIEIESEFNIVLSDEEIIGGFDSLFDLYKMVIKYDCK